MKINIILVLISSFNVISISFGLSTNQTLWKKVTQFNPEPKALVDVFKKNIEIKDIADEKKTSNERKTLDYNIISNKNSLKSNSDNQTDFAGKSIMIPKVRMSRQENIFQSSTKEKSKKPPLNIILLFVNGLDEQSLQLNSEILQYFPTQGFFQSCSKNFGNFLFSQTYTDCGCEDSLRTSISSLILWAQNIQKMSISSTFEISGVNSRDLEINTQNIFSPQNHRIYRQIQKSWQLNDSKFHTTEDKSHDKELWRVKDILNKLREAFFHTLINNIDGSTNTKQRVGDFRALATRTFEDLQKMANQNGYLLVITASKEELPDALQLLHHYVQPLDSLVVVTGTCTMMNIMPFFARGPGSKQIDNNNFRVVHELPNIVRTILSDKECTNPMNCEESLVREEIAANLKPSLTLNTPILVYDEMESPRNRFSRSEQQDNKIQEKSMRLDKDLKEKTSESKKSDAKNGISFNTINKNGTNLNTKELLGEMDIKIRVGEELAANNSHEVIPYSTLVIAEILIIITNYVLKF